MPFQMDLFSSIYNVAARTNDHDPGETTEDLGWYRVYYEHCGQEWQQDWSCACNDRCPVCRREIEPYDYEDIDDEDATKD